MRASDAKFARILDVFSDYAGRALTLDEVVFQSECMTGHRNRAIGHMLRNFDIIEDDPDPVLQVYFQQCSIAVTCRDLSIMAATLANGGENPVTGKRVLEQTYVDNVLSIMATCGMYDYSGEWFYNIGLPAKSGVCGGIVAVLPGQLGIAVFSPALDARGNSVRGIGVCKELSTRSEPARVQRGAAFDCACTLPLYGRRCAFQTRAQPRRTARAARYRHGVRSSSTCKAT